MGLLKNIEWAGDNKTTLVYKLNMKNDYISKGSVLTVREGQAAIFCHKGKMADVFLPGYYKLDTDSIPFLTKLMSWKYGFENPFRSEVYFVNTTQFTDQKWGTSNPIILRDADYGAIRVRGFGTYSFRIDDAFVFMTELTGTNSSFRTQEITEYLKSIVIMGITDALGESKIPLLDMAANLMELSRSVEKSLSDSFKDIGLKLVKFNFQNFSLPEELEKALDQSASLGMIQNRMGTYMQKSQADAMLAAAKNPGTAGTAMGAGMGIGMGAGMGHMFNSMMNNNMNNQQQSQSNKVACSRCNAMMNATAKFCPECGAASGTACPSCKKPVKAGAKFCPECGEKLTSSCPKCKSAIKPGAKFCPDCGEKL